jgi:hypothetical protein
MGFDVKGSWKSLVATKNSDFDQACQYYLDHQNDSKFLEEIPMVKEKKKVKKPRHIPLELQRLFTQLQLLDQKAISTEGLFILSYLHLSVINIDISI